MNAQTPAPLRRPAASRLVTTSPARQRTPPKPRAMARRRRTVWMTKWLLPLGALILLGSIGAWPEINRLTDNARVSFRRSFQLEAESGRLLDPKYHGVDERGRPYTVTATTAQQETGGRIVLTEPKGDLLTETGSWLMAEGKDGVFIQRRSLMDLANDVVLTREDGLRLYTDAVAMDLKAGAASSADNTHAEGPFGTLDALNGFTLVDRGAVIQFHGPSHLVLNNGDQK